MNGKDGANGLDGVNGKDGADGASCTVNDNDDGTKTLGCDDGTNVIITDGQYNVTDLIKPILIDSLASILN